MDWVKDIGTLMALMAMIGSLRSTTRVLTGEVRLLREQMSRVLTRLERGEAKFEVLECQSGRCNTRSAGHAQ